MAQLYRERTNWPPQLKWLDAAIGVFFFAFFLLDVWIRDNFNWVSLLMAAAAVLMWFRIKRNEDGVGPTSFEVDDRGLTYRHLWIVRHWSWSELSAPEMARSGVTFNYENYISLRPASPIDWVGRLLLPGLASSGSEIRIRPIFGVPLEEMLKELKACRGRASLGDEAPGVQAALPA